MRPTQSTMIHNIVSVYRLATTDEHARGRQWYPLAHSIMADWSTTFDRSIANVACVTAALSLQVSWERNLVIAADVLSGNPPSIGGCILRFVRAAERIRDEHATDTVSYFKQGCKVRSFAANLAGAYDVVTVDTHGAQIAVGDPAANLRVDTWHRYEPVARAYVSAAKRLPSSSERTTSNYVAHMETSLSGRTETQYQKEVVG